MAPLEEDVNFLKFLTSSVDIIPELIPREDLASIMRYIDGPYMRRSEQPLRRRPIQKKQTSQLVNNFVSTPLTSLYTCKLILKMCTVGSDFGLFLCDIQIIFVVLNKYNTLTSNISVI